MEIAAAYPRWPWSDLVDALDAQRALPGQRNRAVRAEPRTVGVEIQSYDSGLYALGQAEGYIAPPAPTRKPN